MNTQWDSYEFNISDTYASALINGDWSGLSEDEGLQLVAFLDHNIPVGLVGHWDGFAEEDANGFSRDAVSGLKGDCYSVRFMFHITEAP
jgi:hypothetical protein